ncbi:MAG: CHAT domain-containing protein [Coleofasciculus sp. S288]|nr:CHAT domain-containing protein [Coleofasciculus sp. S288]
MKSRRYRRNQNFRIASLFKGGWGNRNWLKFLKFPKWHLTPKHKYLPIQQQTTKILFVCLFLVSFFLTQGVAWVSGAGNLPVVAQTPTEVTTLQDSINPDALVEDAKRLFQAEQFAEALSRLQQAANAYALKGDLLGQAKALDLQGQVNLVQAQPETAVENFATAAASYEQGGEKTEAIKSRLNQAEALRKMGMYRRALDVLKPLNKNLPEDTDPLLNVIVLRSLGITQRLIGNLDEAKESIEQSLGIAAGLPPSEVREENISAGFLMLGNIAKDQRNIAEDRGEDNVQRYYQEAIASYQKAADTATTPRARIEAQLNQLSVLGDANLPFTDEERELLSQIRETIDQLPLSQTAVHARINWARMVMEPKNEANVNPQDIAQQLAIAIEEARKLKDPRSESYALGQLGELRQKQGELTQAQENTKQALLIAQSIGAYDIAYRWQWQLGQILKDQGKTEGAIASYQAAVKNLESIRGDLVKVNPEVQYSFRDSVEPVYRELAGLLLQSENPENMKQARTVIESLQQAELVDFFREDCLTANSQDIDAIIAETAEKEKAALIYPFVLEDSLEVLVTLPNPDASQSSKTILRRYTTTLRQDQVEGILEQLRQGTAFSRAAGLEIRLSEEQIRERQQKALELAQQVYGWFIKPFEADLENSGVQTLVFISRGPLLNLPMSVLHDGEKFLVEKYAIAQTPGLELLDPKPLARGQLTALKAGLTQQREVKLGGSEGTITFSPLPNVEYELNEIREEVSGKILLNEEFTTDALQEAVDEAPFPVVHLATRGKFSSKPEETFILTWDGRINIDELQQSLGREQGGRNPIELLVLSACETAIGDKRGGLGLAAVAVKAGARSTLATLWQVDDEGTAELMIRFYEELKNTTISKAEALRRAQRSFIEQPEGNKFREPYYWAPFVLVGNWL